MLLGEWAHFGAPDQNNTNRKPFSFQRGHQYGSNTLPVDGNLSIRELGCVKRLHILNVDQFIVDYRSAGNRTADSALIFSSRRSRGLNDTGSSIAVSASSWSRWFCSTSRAAPMPS